MEPTPLDDRTRNARSDDTCLSEALDWIVRLNRLRISEAEIQALGVWCARSAAHARAWRQAMALWQLLLPVARELPQRRHRRGAARHPRIARRAGDIRPFDRSAEAGAAPDTPSSHFRPRQSWS